MRTYQILFAAASLVTACSMSACSGDDNSPPESTGGAGGTTHDGGGAAGTSGKAGTGGAAGKAGSGGTGGVAGGGGTAGVAGKAGSAGTAGQAGSGGQAGSSGQGGTAGTAGTTDAGGAGGEEAGTDAEIPDGNTDDATPDAEPADAGLDVQGSDAGDASDESACTGPGNCPTPPNECVTATCTAGQCGTSNVSSGTAITAQTAGDCHKNQCDGLGNIQSVVDDLDLPTSTGVCVTPTCTNGTPSMPPKPVGTNCGVNMVCNGSGVCVGCTVATDCPGQDTECKSRVCNSGVCEFSFALAGKPVNAQTAGDCHQNQCDGAGAIVNAIDNTDVPVDGKSCTSDVCTVGVPSNPAVAAHTACSQNGGTMCDGIGKCVQCLVGTDCAGTDTDCHTRTCTLGICGVNNATVGTPTSSQTAGDCHQNQCDGSGGTVSAIDNTDVPVDNKSCTDDVCVNGIGSNPPVAAHTACAQNGGTMCDGAGACVQCLLAADCGVDTECAKRTCTLGACGINYVTLATPTGTQVAGDCHQNQCDGVGNIQNVIDDQDVPTAPSQCTVGVCTLGAPSTPNAPPGTTCTEKGGIQCDGKGACTQSFTVLRIGAGASALTASTTEVFLDTYYPLAGSAPVSTVAMPTAVSASNLQLTLSGTATSEGSLGRSTDGHFLSLAGYAGATGVSTTGLTRVVGRVDAAGVIDTSTSLAATAFAGSNVRGAVAVDGTNFWVSGNSSSTGGGVWYVALGALGGGVQIAATPNNARWINIFAGQLYATSGSAGYVSVNSVGAGLPTMAGQTTTPLAGMTASSPYGFVLFDLDSLVPGVDTLFVADSNSGLQRWTFNGTTWAKDAAFTVITTAVFGVTGWNNGTGVTLIVSGVGAIQRVDVPTVGTPTATPLITAATNTVFRGVALAAH